MTDHLFRPQFTPAIQRVLERLYSETIEQDPVRRAEAQSAGLSHEGEHGFYQAMAEARMPVTPEFGALLYVLARSRINIRIFYLLYQNNLYIITRVRFVLFI
ncbi:hypothetical protein [Komagataeibacter saccharivorans]|uniref:hypothetical protein n=1 Tax=Komagataeibacter saccharivorans TaxID=265959 RepID=UPI0011B3F88C|nr:hypothetical protein [Komagataeibacter saccharivorans]